MNKIFAKYQEIKNSKKSGFTLVELIVVLVILAIIAALLIPSLTGYIDKANEKKIIAEARMVAMAGQTTVSDAYGSKDTITKIAVSSGTATVTVDPTTNATTYASTFESLAEVTGYDAELNYDESTHKLTSGTVTVDGYTATYDGDTNAWTVAKD